MNKSVKIFLGLSVLFSSSIWAQNANDKAELTVTAVGSEGTALRPYCNSFITCTLSIPVLNSASLRITNNSTNVVGSNITTALVATTEVTQDTSDCVILNPGTFCTIVFTSHAPINPSNLFSQDDVLVSGNNVRPVILNRIQVV